MRYLGEYILEIENNTAEIPWKDENMQESKWILVKTIDEEYTSTDLFITTSDESEKLVKEQIDDGVQIEILGFGKIELSSGNLWEIPHELIEFLDDDTIVFIGLDNKIQMMSKRKHDEMQIAEKELISAIEEHFKNNPIDISKGLEDIAAAILPRYTRSNEDEN